MDLPLPMLGPQRRNITNRSLEPNCCTMEEYSFSEIFLHILNILNILNILKK